MMQPGGVILVVDEDTLNEDTLNEDYIPGFQVKEHECYQRNVRSSSNSSLK